MAHRLVRNFVVPLLLLLCLQASSMRGEDAIEAALHRLKAVEIFAVGPVGYAGITSSGEKDYRLILREPNERAISLFSNLYANGNAQAKAYALAGIRRLDPARFKALYESFPGAKVMVKVEEGCIVSDRDMRGIAKEINAGKFPYDK